MNFSNHQNHLIQMIEKALEKPKKDLVGDFKVIFNVAKSLYKTKSFDFWLNTIGTVEISELPITYFGHHEALAISKKLKNKNRNDALNCILRISEILFTYSNEDDCCILQSTYHFYYSLTGRCVFKSSELGILEGIEGITNNKFRIATISELNIKADELYA